MLYLINVTIHEQGHTMECPVGIVQAEKMLCNVTKSSGRPYFRCWFQEVINGQVIKQGYGIFWGVINKKQEVQWHAYNPIQLKEILENGPRSFHWVSTLITVVDYAVWDDYWNESEAYMYTCLEKYYPGLKEQFYGELVTRRVALYRDEDGCFKNEYTCLVYGPNCQKEEKIRKEFSYHGKTVIDCYQLV